jgi:hypothetical protein
MENQNNLLVQLASIVERLNLEELFPKPQPLEVELGCGDASFLVEYARRNPERNFIGVERLLGRIQNSTAKAAALGWRICAAFASNRLIFAIPAAAAFGCRAAHLFPRSVAEEKAPPTPAHQRNLSRARPHRACARRRGLFADGRRGLFPADDGSLCRE